MVGSIHPLQSIVRQFQVGFIICILVISLAAMPITVGAQSSATVSFEDQRTTGHDVYLDDIVIPFGGWVDVQNADGEVLWTNRGSVELPYFEAGEPYSGWIDIAPALTHNQTLTAVVYNDTNQNQVYNAETDEKILQRNAWMTVQIVSDFEYDAEGWTYVRSTNSIMSDSLLEPREPEYRSSGGASGGYISASDGYDGSNWDDYKAIREWNAPWYYLGDRSNFYGGTLSYDARGSVDWEACSPGSRYEDRPTLPYDVSFHSGDRELRYRFINKESTATTRLDWYGAAPRAEWSRYEIPIRAPANQTELAQGIGAGRWDYYEVRDGQRGSFTDGLTESTFLEVFSALDRIEIQGESVNELRDTDCEGPADGEEGHLDNVVWNVMAPAEDSSDSDDVGITTVDTGDDGIDGSESDQDSSGETTLADESGVNGTTSTSADGIALPAVLLSVFLTVLGAKIILRKRE